MFGIFALGIYSVQWLGVVLGVGAEVVLLCAHLINLHEHKPLWLASIPAVRAAQSTGLVLVILSGFAAVGYQFLAGKLDVLLLPIFIFKWVLILALVVAYMLEKDVMRGHAMLEGFTGATWLALFIVHSVAPMAPWVDLLLFYAAWLGVFYMVWGGFVLIMKNSAKMAVAAVAVAPKPVSKPAPVVVAKKEEPPAVITPLVKKESLWHKLASLFAHKPSAAVAAPAPIVAPAPAPVVKAAPPPPPPPPVIKVAPPPPPPPPPAPKPVAPPAPVVAAAPANLPVVEHLELVAPHAAPPPAPRAPGYIPDYNHIPGLRIMPQRVEDLHLQNRAPIVQPA